MQDQKRIIGANTGNYDNLGLALFTTENKASIRATAKFIAGCFYIKKQLTLTELFSITISYD